MPKDPDRPISGAEALRVDKISVMIPQFWPDEPELWFAQAEGQFSICKITEDDMRYAYILSKLEPKHAREIKDVITNPPPNDKYGAIKRALIQRLTVPQEQRIRQLLEQEEIGDRKPSQFLRHLRTLAGMSVPGELLRTLWLGRLPAQTQAILATRGHDDLEEVAEQADRIHEIGNRAVVLATTASSTNTPTSMEAQIEALRGQVATLTTKLTQMNKQFRRDKSRDRQRERTRNRSKSQTREGQTKKPRQEGVCYYHRRFGSQAEKCTKPCTYVEGNEEGSR